MAGLRWILRRLSRAPGFVLASLGVLVVCLAANLVIHAVLHSLLWQPLPFPRAEQLVTVYNSYPQAGLPRSGASIRDYFTRRNGQVEAFSSVSSYRHASEPVAIAGQVQRRPVLRITPEFFDTLGIGLASGRRFADAEMNPGAQRVAIISEGFRRSVLGGRSALGERIEIGGTPHTVVGVVPAGFRFLSSQAELFLPLVSTAEQRALNALHGEQAEMLGRLAEGVDPAQALAQIKARHAATSEGYPWARQVEEAGFTLHLAGLQEDHVAAVRPLLWLLQAGAVLLLAVGAANLLNLALLRHGAGRADASVRWALGAGQFDLLLPVIAETLLLCTLGTLIALAVAWVGLQVAEPLFAAHLPMGLPLSLGGASLLAGLLGGAALAGVLVGGLVIASRQTPALPGAASSGRSRSADRKTARSRQYFAGVQMALAFVLLAAAGALGIGLEQARRSAPGFDAEHSLVAALDLPASRYPDTAARLAFARQVAERMQGTGGVQSLGFSTNVPVRGAGSFNDRQAIQVVGFEPVPGQSPLLHNRYGVAGDYFRALGIELIEGRYLQPRDLEPGSRAVVVDQDFARFYWPEGEVLGQRLFNGPDAGPAEQAFTVVGVVASVRQQEVHLGRGNGTLYFPYTELPHPSVFVVLRTSIDPEMQLAPLRAALAGLDPALALDDVRPMRARIDDTLAAYRAPALLSTLFAAAAVMLAGVGSAGLLAYLVGLQRREIGMRLALGARSGQILRRYLGFGLRVCIVGALVGGLLSMAVLHGIGLWLPGVPTAREAAPGAALLVLCAVALLSSVGPALRAARIPPRVVLEED